ncbi:NAD(P)/FAD-dependent oxidoreductase [Streptomyces sp. LP05-1]|uniref:NAD(P)/FAD-dependent oxidoreductase n=1 Tax=Streptomyces pyxinae TaxID=2970734 RepID=A0ABT2CBR2_9ACTN|nr:NAD(P)/FAD-dependent oxidoreductase [Streptomyces sp. LP05-1]MCS0634755.1 NAD(P)/FAD-dependent oxidoreductase [Streptomyces sp. LP05-1]
MTTAEPRLAVIGAGPAGLAAALAAADRGLGVTLLDAADGPGGQFYRQPAPALGARRPEALHHRWSAWRRLRARLAGHLATGQVRQLTAHHVWCAERSPGGFLVHALYGPGQDRPVTVRAAGLVLATGGYEQVLPFPGWTLPGVVTAGGAQALLKGNLVRAGHRAVVAGTGPLLLPVAAGLAATGTRVAALVEAADPREFTRCAAVLAGYPAQLAEAAGYAAALLRHRVPVRPRHTVVRAHGTVRLEAVTVAALDGRGRVRSGTGRRIACDTLAVGHGLLPSTELARVLGCRTEDRGVTVDPEQRTDVPGIWAAGETTGGGGAALALAEGHIAGCSAAARLAGRAPDSAGWAGAARTRGRLRRFAAVLEPLYGPPAHWDEQLTDDTPVCRCEEVDAGTVRAAVRDLGAGDARTAKLLTRAGMGWCQGRMCGPAVAALAGGGARPTPGPFARPVPLGVLARAGEEPEEAVPGHRATPPGP